jgi:hypothetical protein
MFARWIPEALDQIEALAKLPEPPTPWAIQQARREVASAFDSEPMPRIGVDDYGRKKGVRIEMKDGIVSVAPDGKTMKSHDGSW